jgi:hypothetical protein
MGGWMAGKAGLSIAYSNQKTVLNCFYHISIIGPVSEPD